MIRRNACHVICRMFSITMTSDNQLQIKLSWTSCRRFLPTYYFPCHLNPYKHWNQSLQNTPPPPLSPSLLCRMLCGTSLHTSMLFWPPSLPRNWGNMAISTCTASGQPLKWGGQQAFFSGGCIITAVCSQLLWQSWTKCVGVGSRGSWYKIIRSLTIFISFPD